MAAIRMEENNKVTVLINPVTENNEVIEGVFLTNNYENGSGILPEENLPISNNKDWFYYLGYNKLNNKPCYIADSEENINILNNVREYIRSEKQ
jgi:hypothetical protein